MCTIFCSQVVAVALTKSGNQLDVAVDDSSIEVNSDALRVKALGITNAMLAGSIDGVKLKTLDLLMKVHHKVR